MAFNALINSIAPIETPSDWVRPLDWITIIDTPNEVQFLVADTGEKCFSIVTAFTRTTGNIYIDWGDGVTDTISTIASTTTDHTYSTGGTPCSRGYNTFKVRVYGDATTTITTCYHKAPTVLNNSKFYNIGLLEVYHGDGCCTTDSIFPSYNYSSNGGFGSTASFSYLEYFKFPATVSYTTAFSYLFVNCINLYKVVMPTSMASVTAMTSTFQGCINLRECIFPSNMPSLNGSFSDVFTGCINLKNVILPSTLNSVTSFAGLFTDCRSLKNLTLPSINACNSLNATFSGCTSLQWVKFTSLPTASSVNISNTFGNCYNLQNVYFPSTCLSTSAFTASNLFSGCHNLKNINFPTNFNPSTLSSAFQNCYKLTDVVFNSPMSNMISFSSAFTTCVNLKTVILPATVSSTVILTNMFNACYSLESMTIPSVWNIIAIDSMFNNCLSIKTIVLPNNAQNSITSMATAFQNCYKLQNLTLPTSLTGVTSLNNTFNNCQGLTNVSLPTTMNSCTTMLSSFLNCSNLQTVTLPTSMNVCTSFATIFQTCSRLSSVVMPATIAATNPTYSAAFAGCTNLNSITFPTTQNTSLATMANIFNGCGSLKTLINLNKLGSLGATPVIGAAIGAGVTLLPSLSFNCPFSQLTMFGTATSLNKLNSVRLLNTSAGQYGGTSPQINFSYCDLGIAALDQLFTDLPTITGKTIDITGCTGTAGCTRTIATGKGWTVIG